MTKHVLKDDSKVKRNPKLEDRNISGPSNFENEMDECYANEATNQNVGQSDSQPTLILVEDIWNGQNFVNN